MMDRMRGSLVAVAMVLAAWPALGQMTLPGKFEVTDTGAASYTIPISVVPGTAGLEPKLSLQYDSRGGNGLLGVGWSLAGLPAITRCGRTIAQDGQAGGVAYDANDRFCLDGQRLIAISGTYGADGTEYRTERESFSKVISYGSAGSGPAWFKVWTKAGLVMEFGNTADSRIEAQGKASVRVWAINKTADTKGNYFTVSYTEDNANGEYRPLRIDYTGNGSTAPANSVRFVYEARPDVAPLTYQGGSLIKATQRLTKAQVWQAETLMREYRITYEASPVMGGIRLATLTQCDGANQCLPGTTLTYTGATSSWTSLPNVAGANATMSHFIPHIADFNGDGKADIFWNHAYADGRSYDGLRTLWVSNGDGTFQVISNVAGANATMQSWRPFIYDFNGDGKADILWDYSDSYGFSASPPQRKLWLSNGDGTFTVSNNVAGADGTLYAHLPRFADFNGDGRPDIFWDHAETNGRSDSSISPTRYLWLSNASGGFTVVSNLAAANGTMGNYRPFIHDFNGDGKADIFWDYSDIYGHSASPPQRKLWLSNGDGTFTVSNNVAGADGTLYAHRPRFADFNGDGRMDVFWDYAETNGRSDSSISPARYLWLSNSSGGFTVVNNLAGANGMLGNYRPILQDFNGDGLTDILWYHSLADERSNDPGVRLLWLSRGDGTFSVTANLAGADGTLAVHYPYTGDFNGDGKLDVLWDYGLTGHRSNDPPNRTLWLGRGDGTFQAAGVPVADGANSHFVPWFADFSGDGKTDVLWNHSLAEGLRSYDGLRVLWTFQGYQAPANDLLAAVVAGTGLVTTVTSERITAGTFYAKDTGLQACSFPCQDINGPLWVTKEVKSSNGLGGEYRSTYRYAGAKADQHGRGFLGFRQMTVKDEQTGVEQVTTYRQDYPFTGLLASREKKLGAQLLNRSTNSYSSADLGGTRRYPFLTQSLEESWELSGAALPAVTTGYEYDAFGNATQVGVSTGDGYSKSTTNTYNTDAANWLLGRLTRSEVTSTTPGN